MSSALLFPGQGSQSVGMLAQLADEYSVVKAVFQEAADVLGYDLWDVVQNGPAEKLNLTEVTQPALLTASYAVWKVWQEKGGAEPMLMAGHSLGEYSALVCAGAIEFAQAVSLVEARGRFMQEAVPDGVGAMAAIVGLDEQAIIDGCETLSDELKVGAANFNSPGQVVIAGHREKVEAACAAFKVDVAKMAKLLPVSVPSHSALMTPAAEKLSEKLESVTIAQPRISVLQNIDAAVSANADAIRDKLVQQLYSPVQWVNTAQKLAEEGAEVVVEAGPGKVLAGLNKRIIKQVKTLPVFDPAGLDAALEASLGE